MHKNGIIKDMNKIIIALVALLTIGGAFYIVNLPADTIQKEVVAENVVKKTEITLNLPTGWSIFEQTADSVVLNGSYSPGAAAYVTLYYFDKNPNEDVTTWKNNNREQIKARTGRTDFSTDDKCEIRTSGTNGTVYNCTAYAQSLLLVNTAGNKVVMNFGGQDPVINAEQLLGLVSFK